VWLVARREVRERLKARSFRIATIISAGVVVAAIAIPASQRGKTPTYDVGMYGNTGTAEIDAVKALAPGLNLRVRIHPVSTLDEARAQLRTGQLDIVVNGTDEILSKRRPEPGDTGKKAQLIAALGSTLRVQRVLAQGGPDAARLVDALRTPVAVSGVVVDTADPSQRLTAFFGVLLLFVFLQQYGAWVLVGVVEEKASRVVEVLLSAVRPRQLVAGKVLGIGGVALVQGLIVAAAALITAQTTGTHVFEGTSRYMILWTLAWFVLGYGLYSWAYAAVGSTVSRQADAQNAAFPLTIPVLVGYISVTSLLSGGDPSSFVRVIAFLPPTAPMVMPMLIGLGKVAMWEVALSMAGVAVSIVLLMKFAGDIYARAILHTGRRLHFREVFRRDFNAA
jgi:ABC-2 type transport system permease protein